MIILMGVALMLIVAGCSKKDRNANPQGNGAGENELLLDPELHIVIGKVVDLYDGTPIIGATVLRKTSATGTVTDALGNFSILVPFGPSERLVISYTGYETKELVLSGTTNFGVINLKPDVGPQ